MSNNGFQKFDSKELELLIKEALASDNYALAAEIADELNARENPDCDSAAMKHSVMSYIELSEAMRKKSPPRVRKIAFRILAATLCILLSTIAVSAEEHIVSTLARWTKDVFSFGPVEEESNFVSFVYSEEEIPSEFETLQDALDFFSLGITEPEYVPEGYSFSSVQHCIDADLIILMAEYTSGDDIFIVQISNSPIWMSSRYEKVEGDVDLFLSDEYYYVENEENKTFVCMRGSFECSVHGTLDQEELLKILNSMGD